MGFSSLRTQDKMSEIAFDDEKMEGSKDPRIQGSKNRRIFDSSHLLNGSGGRAKMIITKSFPEDFWEIFIIYLYCAWLEEFCLSS
jgi:hypothetical protein